MRLLLVLLLSLTVGLASASVKNDIDRQYKRWAKAALTNDVETILAVLTPDYVLHTYTGTAIPRKAYEASLRKRRQNKEPATAYQTQIASLTVKGAIAEVISDETSAKLSIDPITAKKLKMIHIHRYLDTWVKMGSSWRLRTTVTQVESTKVVPVG